MTRNKRQTLAIFPTMTLLHQDSPAKIAPRTRIRLPFIDTSPLMDVRLAIFLLPVWWLLGVEQFIWPVIFGIATIKLIHIQKWRLRVSRPLRWFALFLVAVLISSLFIEENYRYFTFVRNLGAFAAGFLVFLIVTNQATSQKAIDKLLNAVLLAMIIASAVGLLAVLDIWRPSILSPMGRLLPGSIASTSYGRVIAYRDLGQFGWFVGLGQYFRLSSFFLFGNYFSSAIVYVLPFLFMRMGQSRPVARVFVGLAIVLLIINLIYTTGRVAVLSILIGALYYALFHARYRRKVRVLTAIGLVLGILGLLALSVIEFSRPHQEAGVIEQAASSVEAFVFARGTGSFTDRFGVYEASLKGFAERPFFGWGTERDVEGLVLPAGSHSEYMAALYRQGLLGVIAMAGLLITTWLSTIPPLGEAGLTPGGTLLRYGRWFFAGALVNSVMNDPAVDTTSYVIMWLLYGLLVATALRIKRQAGNGSSAH